MITREKKKKRKEKGGHAERKVCVQGQQPCRPAHVLIASGRAQDARLDHELADDEGCKVQVCLGRYAWSTTRELSGGHDSELSWISRVLLLGTAKKKKKKRSSLADSANALRATSFSNILDPDIMMIQNECESKTSRVSPWYIYNFMLSL